MTKKTVGLPFATDPRSRKTVRWDPATTPHIAVLGEPGTGKTETVARLAFEAAKSGGKVYVISTAGQGDFRWLEGNLAAPIATELVSAVTVLDDVFAAIEERRNASDNETFPELFLFVDALDALLNEKEPELSSDVFFGVPDDRPPVPAGAALRRAVVASSIAQIARTADDAGVHLVVAAPRPAAWVLTAVPGLVDVLKASARLLLGEAHYPDRLAGLVNTDGVDIVPHGSPVGTGVWEPSSDKPGSTVRVTELDREDAFTELTVPPTSEH